MDYTIGQLAAASGVGVETVRFYERKGLVRQPVKREGGYRKYPREEALRIHFVKRAQELGFTLKEVKELLDLQFKKKLTGAQMRLKVEEKVEEVRQKLADLKKMERSLVELGNVCGTGEQAVRECKIFNCFGKPC